MSPKRYTQNNKALTDLQRDFYEEYGYIVVKNNVPHDLIDELCARFIDICDDRVPHAVPLFVARDRILKQQGYKGQYAVNKIQDFFNDRVLFKYASYPAVTDVVESIIGPNFVGVHSMLINKPPDAHPELSVHPLHQDLYYFTFRPANTIVGSWTAMEAVNEMNGCLYAIPGSHRREELYRHDHPKQNLKNALYHGVQGFENEKVVNFVMDKGDTVFFHPLLLHGSGVNRSKGSRKAISVHFAASNSYFTDAKGTVQEQMVKEVEYYYKLDYMTVWKMKLKHIKGSLGWSFTSFPSSL